LTLGFSQTSWDLVIEEWGQRRSRRVRLAIRSSMRSTGIEGPRPASRDPNRPTSSAVTPPDRRGNQPCLQGSANERSGLRQSRLVSIGHMHRTVLNRSCSVLSLPP